MTLLQDPAVPTYVFAFVAGIGYGVMGVVAILNHRFEHLAVDYTKCFACSVACVLSICPVLMQGPFVATPAFLPFAASLALTALMVLIVISIFDWHRASIGGSVALASSMLVVFCDTLLGDMRAPFETFVKWAFVVSSLVFIASSFAGQRTRSSQAGVRS